MKRDKMRINVNSKLSSKKANACKCKYLVNSSLEKRNFLLCKTMTDNIYCVTYFYINTYLFVILNLTSSKIEFFYAKNVQKNN